MAFSSHWHKSAAVGALLLIWLLWSVLYLNPGRLPDELLSKLPVAASEKGSSEKGAPSSSSKGAPSSSSSSSSGSSGGVGGGKGGAISSAPLSNIPSSSSSSSASTTSSSSSSSGNNHDDNDAALRPLVLYTYAESANARENLAFFLRNGLNHAADFVFIFNGDTDAADLLPADRPNVRAVHRPNTCFDIGAHGEVLRTDDLWKRYKRFIMMNASIRGPFMPTYAPGCWMDAFFSRITDSVKLVGTTLNCSPRTHVQSMLLATDDVGMGILLDPELSLTAADDNIWGSSQDRVGLSPCFTTMKLAVHAEIGMMSLIESQGYSADVLMTAPHSAEGGAAGRFEDFCEEAKVWDDFLWDGHYFGANVHPYETIFMKANRDIAPVLLERLTEWHLAANYTSWDRCGR